MSRVATWKWFENAGNGSGRSRHHRQAGDNCWRHPKVCLAQVGIFLASCSGLVRATAAQACYLWQTRQIIRVLPAIDAVTASSVGDDGGGRHGRIGEIEVASPGTSAVIRSAELSDEMILYDCIVLTSLAVCVLQGPGFVEGEPPSLGDAAGVLPAESPRGCLGHHQPSSRNDVLHPAPHQIWWWQVQLAAYQVRYQA
ncbi:hypothetical protein LIA77_00509 [Sarocladium implicatum]|nr:hypothetical protein LIA77_00509 [Sarocladium implicatum]